MTDEKLPLAELLAERASLAIENARLYTEQVEARHKLEDLSRLKDEFLSIASHELRTPVTSIKGYTQLSKMLIKEGDLNTSEEYLDIALDQIDRMSRLILELLDVSRIETGRLEIRREPIPWANFVRDIVFERFHRGRHVSSTNYGGLGLGLYITKQIIERHGGTIWVDSREGQGTTFYFALPAEEKTAATTPQAPQDATMSRA